MTNPLTTPSSTLSFAKTTLAHTTILTDPEECPPSLSTLWLRCPLAHHPPYSLLRLLCDPSPLALPKLW
jgi:hypothetical protein